MILAAWGHPIKAGLVMIFCHFAYLALIINVINVPAIAAGHIGHINGKDDVFTSSFLVRFRRSVDNDFAHQVAEKYGFDNIGPVSEDFENP